MKPTLYREVDIPNPNRPERGTLRWVVPVEPDYIDQPRVRQAILGALLPQIDAGGGIECALLADAAIAAVLGVGEETP